MHDCTRNCSYVHIGAGFKNKKTNKKYIELPNSRK